MCLNNYVSIRESKVTGTYESTKKKKKKDRDKKQEITMT